ncbi:M57 family metalloprotease [Myxococcus stipitatus]|uniref:M57 family metalloprotease n=1 Tax=Myxococcus stipitatus TaxID=83455 RepID=UPI0030CA5C88
MMNHRHAVLLSGIALWSLAGCGGADTTQSGAKDEELSQGITFEEFRAQTNQETESGLFIVDGDIAVDEQGLRDFYETSVRSGQLIINQANRVDTKWTDTQKLNLTYCVSKATFGTRYAEMVQAMNAATAAWEAAAKVNFVHLSQYDTNCTSRQSKVLFDVNQASSTSPGARAFFPNTARQARNVILNSATWTDTTGQFPIVGVLRHELGHALGFRHEHIRPETGNSDAFCTENSNWRALTTYDSASVMHYPWCPGSTGDGSLSLSSKDIQGAQAVYGAP